MPNTLPRPGVSWHGIALLIAAALASAWVWYLHAPRFFVFSETSYGDFWKRRLWMALHVVGGTLPLMIGPLVLWTGLRRWKPHVHRVLGRTYLVAGAVSFGAGAALSVMASAPPRELYAATGTLALAWFGAAFMAYRAIRHRQIALHRDWVIRSYVLTFSFVACRLAVRMPAIEALGPHAIATVVWCNWVVPMLVTEVALQWRRTGNSAIAATDAPRRPRGNTAP